MMKSITDMYSVRQADFSFVPAVNAGISNSEGRLSIFCLFYSMMAKQEDSVHLQ
jgi:hypothetical protein